MRESEKLSRAFDEQIRREAESQERLAAYREARRRERSDLKKLILDDLKLIRRGEKGALGPEAFEAVIALKREEGDHPETLNAWEPLIESLKCEILDTDAAQRLLDDLLYPDALEDEEELTHRISDGLDRATHSGQIEPAVTEAIQGLRRLKDRDVRKVREEREAEAVERREEKERDRQLREEMKETARDIIRLHAQSLGLSANDFDHLSFDKALIQICTLQSAKELANKPVEERAKILRELDRADSEGRQKIFRELDGGLYDRLFWYQPFFDRG